MIRIPQLLRESVVTCFPHATYDLIGNARHGDLPPPPPRSGLGGPRGGPRGDPGRRPVPGAHGARRAGPRPWRPSCAGDRPGGRLRPRQQRRRRVRVRLILDSGGLACEFCGFGTRPHRRRPPEAALVGAGPSSWNCPDRPGRALRGPARRFAGRGRVVRRRPRAPWRPPTRPRSASSTPPRARASPWTSRRASTPMTGGPSPSRFTRT
jgi:hypothetical protein